MDAIDQMLLSVQPTIQTHQIQWADCVHYMWVQSVIFAQGAASHPKAI